MITYADKMRCKHALFSIKVVNQSATAAGIPVNKDKITRLEKSYNLVREYNNVSCFHVYLFVFMPLEHCFNQQYKYCISF